MEPETDRIYRMKKSYIDKIENKNFKIMPHIYGCGNKFRLISSFRSVMECTTCKHRYETAMSMFSEVYEPIKDIKLDNPNILFKRKQ